MTVHHPIRWRIQNRLRLPAALLWGFLSVDPTSSLVPPFLLLAEFDSCDFTRCTVIKSSPTAGLRTFIPSQENNILGLGSLQESSLNRSFFAHVHSISHNSISNMLQHCLFSIFAPKAPAPSPLMIWVPKHSRRWTDNCFTAHDKDRQHPCWERRCFALAQESQYCVPYHLQSNIYPNISFYINISWRREWQPTPAFLPGESQGWGSPVGCHLKDCTGSDTTEAT